MTTVYLIRHSKPINVNYYLDNDNLQLQNEKKCLSVEGEQIAKERFEDKEFNDIDIVFSSNYVRAIQTAKYLADKNNTEINVFSDLGERKFGISSWNELPEEFERKQFLDENYKIGNGESQKEVRERMLSALIQIINENKNRRIAIVSHATALSYLLKNWCNIEVVDDKLRYSYKDKILLDGYFNYCETFKIDFDENNSIMDINNIKKGAE